MKDLEQARRLLAVADRDYRALCGMEDPAVFSDEIFGFHVQQAVEKALKAWLCALGGPFPRTHDLDELGALLEETGQELPEFLSPVLEFTDFAVAFRYDAFPEMEGDIDRRDCVSRVARLLQHVQRILTQSTP
jgi:HEPN domain-containing protein